MMARAMARANRKDLKLLTEILKRQSSNGPDGVVRRPVGLRAPRLALRHAGARTGLPVAQVGLPYTA